MKKTYTREEIKRILESRVAQLYGIKSPRVGIMNLLKARRNEIRELAEALDIELVEP